MKHEEHAVHGVGLVGFEHSIKLLRTGGRLYMGLGTFQLGLHFLLLLLVE